jgi:hypothetical protein
MVGLNWWVIASFETGLRYAAAAATQSLLRMSGSKINRSC